MNFLALAAMSLFSSRLIMIYNINPRILRQGESMEADAELIKYIKQRYEMVIKDDGNRNEFGLIHYDGQACAFREILRLLDEYED